jgi:hypothetical protein
LISRHTDTTTGRRWQRPLLHSKKNLRPWAQVRILPPFPVLNNIFATNNFIFSITLLRTIHGPVDISAQRHHHKPLPPKPSPP